MDYMYVACRLHKPSIDLIKPRLSPLAISISLSSSHSLARLERSTIEKVQATISQKPAKKNLIAKSDKMQCVGLMHFYF